MYKRLVFVVVVLGMVMMACGSPAATSSLSNATVSVCNGVDSAYYPMAPGTLSMQVNGQPATHFIIGQPFTLIYTGDTGDSFAQQQVGVDASPFFDSTLQFQDADSAPFPISSIHGTSFQVTVTFPFTAPRHPNVYTKPGPYCFTIVLVTIAPDGSQPTFAANIGLVAQ